MEEITWFELVFVAVLSYLGGGIMVYFINYQYTYWCTKQLQVMSDEIKRLKSKIDQDPADFWKDS